MDGMMSEGSRIWVVKITLWSFLPYNLKQVATCLFVVILYKALMSVIQLFHFFFSKILLCCHEQILDSINSQAEVFTNVKLETRG